MKRAAILALGVVFAGTPVFAAVAGIDNASNAPYSDGWQTGDNGGSGFGAWTLSGPTDLGQGGFFIGDSTENGGSGTGQPGQSGGINTAGVSFGMYANSGQTADARRPLGGDLGVGQTFTFQIDNGYLNNPGSDGISLLAGANARFEFYFNGGDANYTINDASGAHSSGIGYTDGGLTLEFTPTSVSTYILNVTPVGGSTSTFTGSMLGAPSLADIDTFRAFDYNSSNGTPGNFYVNNLSVPEPASLGLLMVGGLGLLRRRRLAR